MNVSGQPTFSCLDLPAGLTLSNTGLISGTPTNYGSGSSTITVSYAGAENKIIILNWNISEATASDKTYVYTVSGFGMEECNGDYYDSGKTNISNQPIYTNGKVALSNDEIWLWHFHSLEYASDIEAYYWQDNIEADSPVGDASTGWKLGWANEITIGTVTAYTGDETGESTSSDTYIVSGAGMSDANGTYTRSGDTSSGHPLYVNGKFKLYYDPYVPREFTLIEHPDYPPYVYSMQGGSDGNYASGTWGINDPEFAPAPTVVKGASESGDSGDSKTYVYTVSGFTGEYVDANGDYWNTGETSEGQPVYYNGQWYLLYADPFDVASPRWGFNTENVARGMKICSLESGISDIFAISGWSADRGASTLSGVTVAPYGSGGDSGSSDDNTYVYIVSGAGTAGVDGNYYDTGETTKGPVGDDLGFHIYTNGTAKIEWMTDYSQWSISIDGGQKYYIVWDDDAMTTGTTVTVFGEDPAPTISTYSPGNSSSDTTNIPQQVILCGCPMGDDTFTYNETISNDAGYTVYKANNLSHYIYYLNGVWNVNMDYGSPGYFQSPTLAAGRGTWHNEDGTVVDIMSSGVLDGDSVSGGLACWEYEVCLNEATHYCSKCGHAYCEDHRYGVNLSHNCNV